MSVLLALLQRAHSSPKLAKKKANPFMAFFAFILVKYSQRKPKLAYY
jgi:hypothetical protein